MPKKLYEKEKWANSCTYTECSLHQLSPYVGKIKSSIAHDLISEYSKEGDFLVDPFSGAATIPLEGALLGRNVFASDINPYSIILSKAKLFPPETLDAALNEAERLFKKVKKMPDPDLRRTPKWVRSFFHPKTLKESIKFSEICKKQNNYFLMACFLGILHHQRPGFLSYPSSHLVPYLRDKKYPQADFPEMYEYRELMPRLLSKIRRAYKRIPQERPIVGSIVRHGSIEHISFPNNFDCLITSPPYMNALDYGRDNRLRLWFIKPQQVDSFRELDVKNKDVFKNLISSLAKKSERYLNKSGHCIVVIGERLANSNNHLSEAVSVIFDEYSPSLKLKSVIKDTIPNLRRARRNCKNIKNENILIYQKS